MEMSPWIENACITIMLISLVINNIGAYSSVELDKSNCDTKILYISRDIKQTIEWQGDTVIPSYCRVGFEDTDDNPYSICIKFKAFRILACDFAIKVYKDLSKLSIKTYDCVSEDVNDRCFDSKNIYLGFLSNYTGGYTNTKVKIEVYAKEDAETGFPVIAVVILVIAFIPGTYVIVKWGCTCVRKCLCPTLEGMCDCIGDTCHAIGDACISLTSCKSSEPETVNRRHYSSNSSVNIPEEPTQATTTEPNGNLSSSMISIDDIEETPSAPMEYHMAPPPYPVAIPPETMIEPPPPTYYDVMTYDDPTERDSLTQNNSTEHDWPPPPFMESTHTETNV